MLFSIFSTISMEKYCANSFESLANISCLVPWVVNNIYSLHNYVLLILLWTVHNSSKNIDALIGH